MRGKSNYHLRRPPNEGRKKRQRPGRRGVARALEPLEGGEGAHGQKCNKNISTIQAKNKEIFFIQANNETQGTFFAKPTRAANLE